MSLYSVSLSNMRPIRTYSGWLTRKLGIACTSADPCKKIGGGDIGIPSPLRSTLEKNVKMRAIYQRNMELSWG